MNEKRKFTKTYIVTAIIGLVIGAVIFCLFYFLRDRTIIAALDGTGFGAIILAGIAGLIFIARNGFFDIFAYGFKQLGSTLFAKNAARYNDFAGYKDQKNTFRKERSKYYLFLLLDSGILLIVFVILEIVKANLIG